MQYNIKILPYTFEFNLYNRLRIRITQLFTNRTFCVNNFLIVQCLIQLCTQLLISNQGYNIFPNTMHFGLEYKDTKNYNIVKMSSPYINLIQLGSN